MFTGSTSKGKTVPAISMEHVFLAQYLRYVYTTG